MNERIKQIRKHYKLTMEDFGKRLGVTKSAISKMENGSYTITDQMVLSICREYNASENWLRTGDGQMLIDVSRDDEIAAFIGRVFASESDSFKKRFLHVLTKLNSDQWEILESIVILLSKDSTKK